MPPDIWIPIVWSLIECSSKLLSIDSKIYGVPARISIGRSDFEGILIGDEFKRKPDAIKNFYKGHYNRKSYLQPTPSYTCVADNDVWGSGIEINAKAFVYVDIDGPVNYSGVL